MKKKQPKKEYTEEELSRHLGAMAETYHDDVKIMREGVVGITQILERMEKTLDSHSDRLDSHSEQIANLLMDNVEMKSDIKEIKFHVRTGLENKVDKKHFVDLGGRVRKLEKA